MKRYEDMSQEERITRSDKSVMNALQDELIKKLKKKLPRTIDGAFKDWINSKGVKNWLEKKKGE